VDLSRVLNDMRNQVRVGSAANRQAAGRRCVNVDGAWIDEAANDKLPVVKIKAQSKAYFRILERHAQMKKVFQLGNRVVWVTPKQTFLVVDAAVGEEQTSDAAIDDLFAVKLQ
jgi:Ca-activated chloride channel homolog